MTLASRQALLKVDCRTTEITVGDPCTHESRPDRAIGFTRAALSAAIARASTTSGASDRLVTALAGGADLLADVVLAPGTAFVLNEEFDHLADVERTFYAARLGAGVADLYMGSMGFVWRANAQELRLDGDTRPDLVYGGGPIPDGCLALVEAHGSMSSRSTGATVQATVSDKYRRQVHGHVTSPPPELRIVQGHALGFYHRRGGGETGLIGCQSPGAVTSSPGPTLSSTAPFSLVAGSHASNFWLAGAPAVRDAVIRLRRGGATLPDDYAGQEFLIVEAKGRRFLIGSPPGWSYKWWIGFPASSPASARFAAAWSAWRRLASRTYAVEYGTGRRFLDDLARRIRDGSGFEGDVELPVLDVIGFGSADVVVEDGAEGLTLFADGFAALDDVAVRGPLERARWTVGRGLQEF